MAFRTALLGIWLSSLALGSAFELQQLPLGKSITLPHPATTAVRLDTKVRLTATDRQQTIKITSRIQNSSVPVKIAIFDQSSEKVRYVTVKPGASIIYSFTGINSIQLVPMKTPTKPPKSARLIIESNRPLTVGR